VPALIAASAIRTCLGDGARTFAALLRGDCGVGPIRDVDGARLNVTAGYHIIDDDRHNVDQHRDDRRPDERAEALYRPSRWLADCIRDVLADAHLDAARQRLIVLVGTGLRELRIAERCADDTGQASIDAATERLHFDAAVREVCPGVAQVITISNACSAGGHALALAQDLIDLGEADAVIAAATDGMTESMLAMIGRFANGPTPRVRPFDRDRLGALLGEGAAALAIVPDRTPDVRPLARLLSSGMSCDATHETVPNADGIMRAIADAFTRAGRTPADVDLVVAHGTGTALNDPTEAALLQREFETRTTPPLITGIKGALGHTSGAAALMNVDVAIRCLHGSVVPPVVGLRERLDEGAALSFVMDAPVEATLRLAQINAFGFGGVNTITLVEAA